MVVRLARIPPVGAPVCCDVGGVLPSFLGYEARWVESGTAALVLAMSAAKKRHPSKRSPQVVLPAYGCPDLVAAAVCAGVTPVLADIEPGGPGYNMSELAGAITPNTVAVVTVNFLGIAERLSCIREMLGRYDGVSLIEDNAQWFPGPDKALSGDFVCLSYGRGKPVSVLAGGTLLSRARTSTERDSSNVIPSELPMGVSRGRWEIVAYNALLCPLAYGLVSRMPGTGLGLTRFQSIKEVRAFPSDRLSLLPSNVAQYLSRPSELEDQMSSALSEIPGVENLRDKFRSRADRMLRLPILLSDCDRRDWALRLLLKAGIGASALYTRPLVAIPGVAEVVEATGEAPRAKSFADRLLTLPLHPGVTAEHVRRIVATISEAARGG